jgi:hypothetical protein
MLALDLCMSFAFTTIVIAALLDVKEADGKEGLSINSNEASWLGNTLKGLWNQLNKSYEESWLVNIMKGLWKRLVKNPEVYWLSTDNSVIGLGGTVVSQPRNPMVR